MLVRGEAGVGKSSLIREVTARHGSEVHVLVGWCDDLTTPQPLGPFWDIARECTALVEPLAADDRPGVWGAAMRLLAGHTPTVLVIEDTQWADEATLDTIKYLGRRIGRANGLLVLTYRDGEVDREHALRSVIGELPAEHLVRLQLECLAPGDVASMVGESDVDLAEVLALTGGNPLFVTEVLSGGTVGVPASIQDAVLARAAKLPASARRLVDLVSVIPGGADRDVVDAVVEAGSGDVEECIRSGLLVAEDRTVRFHHELTRRAVESTLAEEDRRALNSLVLAETSGRWPVARLVHHAVAAGDAEAIVALAPRAARAATSIASHREAVAHLRALEPHLALVAPHALAGLVEEWARSEWAVVSERSAAVLDRALVLRREGSDAAALARALSFGVRVYEATGRPRDADRCAAEAVALLRQLPVGADLAAALLEQAWLVMVRGDDDVHGVSLADESIAVAEASGDDRIVTRALILKGAIGEDAEGRSQTPLVEEALHRAQARDQHDDETYALVVLAGAAADERAIERAIDLVQRARDTAVRYELRQREVATHAMHAEILLWQGRWADAEDVAAEARSPHSHAEVIAVRVLATIEVRRGRPDSGELLERMWALANSTGELQHLDPAAALLAEHHWLTRGDDPELVRTLLDVHLRGQRSASPWPSGALSFWLWQLGLLAATPARTPDFYRWTIEGRWQDAARLWEERGAPYDRALALLQGDVPDRLLALEIFETLGAGAAADRLKHDLRAAGVRLPRGRARSTRQNVAGLTARQVEVLGLLGGGCTNTEIADRLFISLRTAENHVSSILMKLDVPSREAAVVAARSRGVPVAT